MDSESGSRIRIKGQVNKETNWLFIKLLCTANLFNKKVPVRSSTGYKLAVFYLQFWF
jgi:hypothetical protein